MAFADNLNLIPYAPASPMATGFLPPLLRTMSHLFYLLAALANEDVPVTVEEAKNELTEALNHWTGRSNAEEVLSTRAIAHAAAFEELVAAAFNEWEGWTDEQRLNNTRSLVNRCIGYGAALDRELLGMAGSDPGHQM